MCCGAPKAPNGDDDEEDDGYDVGVRSRPNAGHFLVLASTKPNQANCEDVSSDTAPKPSQTGHIVRTSQAKPGPNQAKPGPNQAICEDVSSDAAPKPGQTGQIARTSQAKARQNQAKPGKL